MARRTSLGMLLLGLAAMCVAVGPFRARADADVPRVYQLQPGGSPPPPEFPRGESVSIFPDVPQSGDEKPKERPRAARLQPESRLELVRYIHGEFARAVKPMPGGKKGFRYQAGKPLDEAALRRALGASGSAVNPGDNVQITNLEFRGEEIRLEINGGGKKKKSWRERISIQVGGVPSVSSTSTTQPQGPPGYQGLGTTLILHFGGPIPDLTVDDLKQHLAPFLDFSKQRSAAVQWIETLPPEFQQAIKDRRAIVGMDREMVVAAMGKPEKKVRERDPDGLETEDWIYGHPPAKTVFVKFAGEKVISVKEFPN